MLAAPKPHLMPIPCPYTRMWDVRVCSLRSLEHALVTTSQPRVDISHLSPECHHARTWRPVLSYVYMDIYPTNVYAQFLQIIYESEMRRTVPSIATTFIFNTVFTLQLTCLAFFVRALPDFLCRCYPTYIYIYIYCKDVMSVMPA